MAPPHSFAAFLPAQPRRSVAGCGTPTVQDFDSLASSGNSSACRRLVLAETDDNANSEYRSGDGTSNSGDTYSFGAAASTERALGPVFQLAASRIGAQLRTTVAGADEIAVAYTGEQWRLGALGRADSLKFE